MQSYIHTQTIGRCTMIDLVISNYPLYYARLPPGHEVSLYTHVDNARNRRLSNLRGHEARSYLLRVPVRPGACAASGRVPTACMYMRALMCVSGWLHMHSILFVHSLLPRSPSVQVGGVQAVTVAAPHRRRRHGGRLPSTGPGRSHRAYTIQVHESYCLFFFLSFAVVIICCFSSFFCFKSCWLVNVSSYKNINVSINNHNNI